MDVANSYNHTVYADFSIIHNVNSVCRVGHLHYHNSFEIFIPLYDGIKCFVNDKLYEIKIGDIFIFPPFVRHKIIVRKDTAYERYVIYFKKRYLTSYSPLTENLLNDIFYPSISNAACIYLKEEQIKELIELTKKLQSYIDSKAYAQKIYMQHILFEIILFISKCAHFQSPILEENKNNDYLKIKDILNYIYLNLANDLSLENLSAKFYINKTSLNNLFKLNTGFSVKHYITDLRITTAKKMLKESDNVSQIYEKVGFNNYSHFIRTFTKCVGTSPKQYSIMKHKS